MHTPQRIEVVERNRVVVEWDDGLASELSAEQLRSSCPCANCQTANDGPVPFFDLGGTSTAPEIDDASLVGDYGITFVFGPDAHHTGIYTWQLLRRLTTGG